MPKIAYLPRRLDNTFSNSGIDVTWTPSAQRLSIGGWYDTCVGIQSDSMTLLEFFELLGITEKDCQKAWRRK